MKKVIQIILVLLLSQAGFTQATQLSLSLERIEEGGEMLDAVTVSVVSLGPAYTMESYGIQIGFQTSFAEYVMWENVSGLNAAPPASTVAPDPGAEGTGGGQSYDDLVSAGASNVFSTPVPIPAAGETPLPIAIIYFRRIGDSGTLSSLNDNGTSNLLAPGDYGGYIYLYNSTEAPFGTGGAIVTTTQGADDTYNVSNSLQILPITLLSFTAQKQDAKSVLLEWTSSLEINSSHFEVERSEDGEHWTKIGEVAAAGNSTEEIDYSFVDRGFNLNRNESIIYYYRLNKVDLDGYQEYSEIKGVRMEGTGYADISLFPNPTSELMHIDISADLDTDMIRYDITDIQGKRVASAQIDITAQKLHLVNLREIGLQSGVYMVRLYNDREVLSSEKIILVSR